MARFNERFCLQEGGGGGAVKTLSAVQFCGMWVSLLIVTLCHWTVMEEMWEQLGVGSATAGNSTVTTNPQKIYDVQHAGIWSGHQNKEPGTKPVNQCDSHLGYTLLSNTTMDISERIIKQLEFCRVKEGNAAVKTIILANDFNEDGYKTAAQANLSIKTHFGWQACSVTGNTSRIANADAVLFRKIPADWTPFNYTRKKEQVWIFNILFPDQSMEIANWKDAFNWTSHYLTASNIPFNKLVKKRVDVHNNRTDLTKKDVGIVQYDGMFDYEKENVTALKTAISKEGFGTQILNVTFFFREKYDIHLLESTKFVVLMQFCDQPDEQTLNNFMFVLKSGAVPVVIGTSNEAYLDIAPPNSFIFISKHETHEQVASILRSKHAEYEFAWRKQFDIVYSKFFVRVCSLLHSQPRYLHHPNIEDFIQELNVC